MARASTKSVNKPLAPAWPGATLWKLDRIKPYPRNARTHPPEQIELLAKLLTKFGPDQPIVVDEKGVILKGHGRLAAAYQAELKDFPVVERAGLSEQDKEAMRIADNQVALLSGWNEQLLKLQAGELKLAGYDVQLLGFSNVELTRLTESNDGEADPEEAPAPPEKPISRRGDIWLLGRHRVMCGDSTSAADVKALYDGAVPKIMATDPPYGVNYDPSWRAAAGVNKSKKKMGKVSNDGRADWTPAWELFTGNVIYCWHGALHSGTVEASLKAAGFEIVSQIIWAKDRFALSRGDYHWRHEPAWYAVRAGKKHGWVGGRNKDTLWSIPAREDEGHGHGTQKPIECMKRPIENSTSAGDVVYDPFVGSGTTVIACEMTGRRCVAMDVDPSYVDVVVRRWEKFTGQKAKLVSGETMEELARTRGKHAPRHPRKSVSRKRKPAAPARRPVVKPTVRPPVPAGQPV